MTDKAIDPEQARLAIELADGYLGECASDGHLANLADRDKVKDLAQKYKKYIHTKHVLDAKQELIRAAIYLVNNYGRHPLHTVEVLNIAAENYSSAIKDEAP